MATARQSPRRRREGTRPCARSVSQLRSPWSGSLPSRNRAKTGSACSPKDSLARGEIESLVTVIIPGCENLHAAGFDPRARPAHRGPAGRHLDALAGGLWNRARSRVSARKSGTRVSSSPRHLEAVPRALDLEVGREELAGARLQHFRQSILRSRCGKRVSCRGTEHPAYPCSLVGSVWCCRDDQHQGCAVSPFSRRPRPPDRPLRARLSSESRSRSAGPRQHANALAELDKNWTRTPRG